MEVQQAKAIIESLLLVADRPLTANEISKVLDGDVNRRGVEALLNELMAEYAPRAFQLVAVANGYQLCTRAEYGSWVRRFVQDTRRTKLSRSAIETLAIVAYKQPMTKAEIEYLRGGVDAGGVLRTLLERRLLKILGRKQVPGRPVMYGTSEEFLLYFGLRNLSELPTLKEFVEQAEDDADLEMSAASSNERQDDAAQIQDGSHNGVADHDATGPPAAEAEAPPAPAADAGDAPELAGNEAAEAVEAPRGVQSRNAGEAADDGPEAPGAGATPHGDDHPERMQSQHESAS